MRSMDSRPSFRRMLPVAAPLIIAGLLYAGGFIKQHEPPTSGQNLPEKAARFKDITFLQSGTTVGISAPDSRTARKAGDIVAEVCDATGRRTPESESSIREIYIPDVNCVISGEGASKLSPEITERLKLLFN